MTSGADSGKQQRPVPYAGFTWESALSLLENVLPEELVGKNARERLVPFAKSLPDSWYWGMFETRLEPQAESVDLLAALVQIPETRSQVRSLFKSGGHPALNGLEGPLRAWSSNDGSPLATSPNLWLEWDMDRGGSVPLSWLCMAPDFFDKSLTPPGVGELVALVRQFIDSSENLEVPGALGTLERILREMPEGGRVMSFSSLKPRGRKAYRVFSKLPRGSTASYLKRIDWPGDFGRLEAHLPLFDVDGEDEWCQLEFSDRVEPYIALELAQTERGFPNKVARERWLNETVQDGLVDPEKAKAVLRWHGQSEGPLPHLRLLRSFHLKLALPEGEASLAKAYLGFYLRKRPQAHVA